ncbi:hypothetical protein EMIT0P74_20294 [Pseudomonas sp. IT-P74]
MSAFVVLTDTTSPPALIPNSFVRQYVVTENIHYKTVDASDLPLHDADVSPIGSTGNTFEQARLTAELFFPDTRCPQGRLKKLTWPERPVQGREVLASNPHEACGRP